MHFVDVKGTVARSLGRATGVKYICACLDVEDADTVLKDTNSKEAIQFLTTHTVACSVFLTTAHSTTDYLVLTHDIDMFRNRGSVTLPYVGVRAVVHKDVVLTGELYSAKCTDFLSFCSNLGRPIEFSLPGETRIDFDFGAEILIEAFHCATARSRPDTVITLRLFNKDVEVYSCPLGGTVNGINKLANRASITFTSPVQVVSKASITSPRFVTSQYVEYNEEVKSVLLICLDTADSYTEWSSQIACLHLGEGDVDLAASITSPFESTFPLMLGLEGV